MIVKCQINHVVNNNIPRPVGWFNLVHKLKFFFQYPVLVNGNKFHLFQRNFNSVSVLRIATPWVQNLYAVLYICLSGTLVRINKDLRCYTMAGKPMRPTKSVASGRRLAEEFYTLCFLTFIVFLPPPPTMSWIGKRKGSQRRSGYNFLQHFAHFFPFWSRKRKKWRLAFHQIIGGATFAC